MFPGFRSRWTIPFEFKAFIAHATNRQTRRLASVESTGQNLHTNCTSKKKQIFYTSRTSVHSIILYNRHHNRLQPFFRDHPGEPVPEEKFWTLWCKGRLTAADTQTIRLGATPSGLTSAHHHPPIFLQAGCSSCRPTNSVKALKATSTYSDIQVIPSYEYCTCCQC